MPAKSAGIPQIFLMTTAIPKEPANGFVQIYRGENQLSY
jgi:hypothetical protein